MTTIVRLVLPPALLMALCACGSRSDSASAQSSAAGIHATDIPIQIKPQDIENQLEYQGKKVSGIEVVAWRLCHFLDVFDEDLYVEEAIGYGTYDEKRVLVRVFRQPTELHKTWSFSFKLDAPQEYIRKYDHEPSRVEWEVFLHDSNWNEDISGYTKLEAGANPQRFKLK
jgi:hypothetical protein